MDHTTHCLSQSCLHVKKDEVPGAVVVAAADSSNLGPYLIKLAKPHASGENPVKGLDYL